jgi:hypothetical protein
MVKTLLDQNSSNFNAKEIENQTSCLQMSIQNQTDRLVDCMS